jgi:16S rRNA (guanine527-N7)-methyltransferase
VGISLSDAQLGQLGAYVGLLERNALPRGMISAGDADRLWERHVLDGLRGVREVPTGGIADLGSGAGIPGVPLAIAAENVQVALIEPRRARASFLEAVIDGTGISNARVVPGKVEDVSERFQGCVARAFSTPAQTWDAAQRLLVPGGVLVYWAGATFDRAPLDELGIQTRLSTHSGLARTGPLVIMGPR